MIGLPEPYGEYVVLALVVITATVIATHILLVPVRIARRRGISEDHVTLVKVLSMAGLLLGITWLVAIALAYLFPSISPPDQFADNATGIVCANCGRKIGKLETPLAFQDNMVCKACHKILSD